MRRSPFAQKQKFNPSSFSGSRYPVDCQADGPAGCGWVLYEMDAHGADEHYSIASGNNYLGYDVSNNQAEYQGLIDGLDYLNNNYISCHGLYVRGDAEIVVRQMEGEYNVNSPNIRPYYNEARESLDAVDCTFSSFRHVSRDRNWEADSLANDAINDNDY